MSSVAEALLASGSKKLALLPPPPKIKKDPPTFSFDLPLAESNDKTYPEFSWTELVRNSKQGEIAKKIDSGAPTLNPYASDDEDDLKAMAAKFEAKYAAPSTGKKKKQRRAEDYIDRGAGYDESDPFIDNSDVYDEIVPPDLQTAHGGFYINSGSLDFKEVELSEDDDSMSSPPKMPEVIRKAKVKITPAVPFGVLPKKNPAGRPPAIGGIKRPSTEKPEIVKKRKIGPRIGPNGEILPKPKKLVKTSADAANSSKGDPSKPKIMRIESSSSSSSSSSEDSSSSSDSDSSEDETTVKNKEENPPKFKKVALPKIVPTKLQNSVPKLLQSPSGGGEPPLKRVKTKNVPLNPKLHPQLPSPSPGSTPPPNLTPPQPKLQPSKDLKHPSPIGVSPPNSKLPPKLSPPNNLPPQQRPPPKAKPKKAAPPTPGTLTPAQLELYQTIANYAHLPGFPQATSILKNGVNLVPPPKAMPNLKKMTPNSGGEPPKTQPQVIHKTPKSAPPKPKPKPKQTPLHSPPTSVSAIFSSPGGIPSFTPTISPSSYKTPPPPLAGPGVEIQKVRTSSVITSGVSSKTPSSGGIYSPASLSLATVTPSIINAHLLSSGITSLSSSLVNSVPSSLSVQRIPQSITITPSQPSLPFPSSLANLTSKSAEQSKPQKSHSSFDMQSLLQNTYTNQILLAASKASPPTPTSKSATSSNARDLQRK